MLGACDGNVKRKKMSIGSCGMHVGALRKLFLRDSMPSLHGVLLEGWQIGDVLQCVVEYHVSKGIWWCTTVTGLMRHGVEHDCSRYVRLGRTRQSDGDRRR
jgi:hypothetical protein